MVRRLLNIFEEVPDGYDNWLDGCIPEHPSFDKDVQIQAIIKASKDLLFKKILNGCAKLVKDVEYLATDPLASLTSSLYGNIDLWKSVISGYKYGVIFLCSRSEAGSFHDLIQQSPSEAQLIDQFLAQDYVAIRAINYGIREYIHDTTIETTLASKYIPPFAIASEGPAKITVRGRDYHSVSEQIALNTRRPIYDLHDFSHFDYYEFRPNICLGMCDLTDLHFSDGILFSEFLTGIFSQQLPLILANEQDRTYRHLTQIMASHLAEFLLGQRTLLHPSTGMQVTIFQPPTPTQLAILAQNKAYELPASEMEQKVFTRGGPVGDSRDELDALTRLQRIEALAGNKRWMYFEVRNTLKHRAQAEAYSLVAGKLVEREKEAGRNGPDVEICEIVREFLRYEDGRQGRRRCLWDMIAEREKKRKEAEVAGIGAAVAGWHTAS